jgi:hypothetical protein
MPLDSLKKQEAWRFEKIRPFLNENWMTSNEVAKLAGITLIQAARCLAVMSKNEIVAVRFRPHDHRIRCEYRALSPASPKPAEQSPGPQRPPKA